MIFVWILVGVLIAIGLFMLCGICYGAGIHEGVNYPEKHPNFKKDREVSKPYENT